MANIKITDLTAYTDAASTDVLPIVDVGADVTKKIAIGDIVKAVPQGTAALPGLAFDGDPNTGIYSPGADQVAISTNGTERMRISSGKLLVGTSTSTGSNSDLVQSHNTTGNNYAAGRFDNTGGGPDFNFYKSRGGSVGTNTTVQNNDVLGNIAFLGANDSTYLVGASISAAVDGVVTGGGANDMPGRLVFFVTQDGSASPTEAMRIKNTRVINFSNAPVYADNAAAKTGGLVDGDVYRTSTGDLKIVYT